MSYKKERKSVLLMCAHASVCFYECAGLTQTFLRLTVKQTQTHPVHKALECVLPALFSCSPSLLLLHPSGLLMSRPFPFAASDL